MIAIRPITAFDPALFVALAGGYTTAERYRVEAREEDALTEFRLVLEALPEPQRFQFPYHDDELAHYAALADGAFTLGAYDGDAWVGVAVGERRDWNNTLWLHEFHVAAGHQRRGIGRRLMDALAERARAAGLRAIVLETQNTNVPAIRFYRHVGFTLDGIHVSYYTNDDLRPDRSVALFMTRRLE